MNVVLKTPSQLTFKDKAALLIEEMLKLPQAPYQIRHYFAPGVYIREMIAPAGTVVIGKIHKTEHLNILERGSVALVNEDGTTVFLHAPLTFVSKAGVQKVIYMKEDVAWKTVHATEETDIEVLEKLLTEDSPKVEIDFVQKELLL